MISNQVRYVLFAVSTLVFYLLIGEYVVVIFSTGLANLGIEGIGISLVTVTMLVAGLQFLRWWLSQQPNPYKSLNQQYKNWQALVFLVALMPMFVVMYMLAVSMDYFVWQVFSLLGIAGFVSNMLEVVIHRGALDYIPVYHRKDGRKVVINVADIFIYANGVVTMLTIGYYVLGI